MDAIYQAIKNLLKSFVNLFVAVVELFAGLINGAASLFLKLRPGELVLRGRNAGEKLKKDKSALTGKTAANEELVCKVRNELKEKITDRNKYILAKAEVEVFECSKIRSSLAGRKTKLSYAVAGILLEEEFKGIFSEENELLKSNEVKMNGFSEDRKESIIQSICEVSKEAIS